MITLIDGSNMLHRALWNTEGKLGIHPIRELYLRFMGAGPKTFIVWDGFNANQRRRDLFPGYKQRGETAEDIKASFDLMKQVLCHCPVVQIEVPTYEADDVLFTLVSLFKDSENEVKLETNDQDFWCVSDFPNLFLPLVNPLPCKPQYTPVFKALVGDKSDKIPGWKGFGPARFDAIETQLDVVESALANKDYDTWLSVEWPKGVTPNEETFFQCCIYYEVVTMMIVPTEDIVGGTVTGKYSPAHAEQLLATWRI